MFLNSCSLEECYPNFDNWQRTNVQVGSMTGIQKKQLAKRVGNEITQNQFETDMRTFHAVLTATWDKAF